MGSDEGGILERRGSFSEENNTAALSTLLSTTSDYKTCGH